MIELLNNISSLDYTLACKVGTLYYIVFNRKDNYGKINTKEYRVSRKMMLRGVLPFFIKLTIIKKVLL